MDPLQIKTALRRSPPVAAGERLLWDDPAIEAEMRRASPG